MKKLSKALICGGGAFCVGTVIMVAGYIGGSAWTLGGLLRNGRLASANTIIREIQDFWGCDSACAECIIQGACTLASKYGDTVRVYSGKE